MNTEAKAYLDSWKKPRMVFACHRHEIDAFFHRTRDCFQEIDVEDSLVENQTSVTPRYNIILLMCLEYIEALNHRAHSVEAWTSYSLKPSVNPNERIKAITGSMKSEFNSFFSNVRVSIPVPFPMRENSLQSIRGERQAAHGDPLLVYYNGHGVPPPAAGDDGEYSLYLFGEFGAEPEPVPARLLLEAAGTPSVFVFDVSHAGRLIGAAQRPDASFAATPDDYTLVFCSCHADEELSFSQSVPKDLFTSCLLSPLQSLAFHIARKSPLVSIAPLDAARIFASKKFEQNSPLEELRLIYASVVETVFWDVLPSELCSRALTFPLHIVELFQNFFLAQRILADYGVRPQNSLHFPVAASHPFWAVLEHHFVYALSTFSLETLRASRRGASPKETRGGFFSFFPTQLSNFQDWLRMSHPQSPSPLQLPSLVRMLDIAAFQKSAAEALALFCDLSDVAINEFLFFKPQEKIRSFLMSNDATLRHFSVFFLAKIVAADPNQVNSFLSAPRKASKYPTQAFDLLSNPIFQLRRILENLDTPPDERSLCLYLLAAATRAPCAKYLFENCPETAMIEEVCLVLLSSNFSLVRLWACILLGRLCALSQKVRENLLEHSVESAVRVCLSDPSPEIRTAAVYWSTELFIPQIGPSTSSRLFDAYRKRISRSETYDSYESSEFFHSKLFYELFNRTTDPSPLVRRETLAFLARVLKNFQEPYIGSTIEYAVIHNNLGFNFNAISLTKESRSDRSHSMELPEPSSSFHFSQPDKEGVRETPSFEKAPHLEGVQLLGEGLSPPLKHYSKALSTIRTILSEIPMPLSRKDPLSGVMLQVMVHLQHLRADPISSIALLANEILKGVDALVWLYLAKQFPFNDLFSIDLFRDDSAQRGRGKRKSVGFLDAFVAGGFVDQSEVGDSFMSSEKTEKSDQECSGCFPEFSQPRCSTDFKLRLKRPKSVIAPAANTSNNCNLPLSFLGNKIPRRAQHRLLKNIKKQQELLRIVAGLGAQPMSINTAERPPTPHDAGRRDGPGADAKKKISFPFFPQELGILLLATFPKTTVGRHGDILQFTRKEFRSAENSNESSDLPSVSDETMFPSSIHGSFTPLPSFSLSHASGTMSSFDAMAAMPATQHQPSVLRSRFSHSMHDIRQPTFDDSEWRQKLSEIISSTLLVPKEELVFVTLTALEMHNQRVHTIRARLEKTLNSIESVLFPMAEIVIFTPLIGQTIQNNAAIQASLSHVKICQENANVSSIFSSSSTQPSPLQNPHFSLTQNKALMHQLSAVMSHQGLGIKQSSLPIGSDVAKQSLLQMPEQLYERLEKVFGEPFLSSHLSQSMCDCGQESLVHKFTRSHHKSPGEAIKSGNTTPTFFSPRNSRTSLHSIDYDNNWKDVVPDMISVASKMRLNTTLACQFSQEHKKASSVGGSDSIGILKKLFRGRGKSADQDHLERQQTELYSERVMELILSFPAPYPALDSLGLCSSGSDALKPKGAQQLSERLSPHSLSHKQIPQTMSEPKIPRISCSVLSRSLYHCGFLISDGLVMPYDLKASAKGDKSPFNFSPSPPSRVSNFFASSPSDSYSEFDTLSATSNQSKERLRLQFLACLERAREEAKPSAKGRSGPSTTRRALKPLTITKSKIRVAKKLKAPQTPRIQRLGVKSKKSFKRPSGIRRTKNRSRIQIVPPKRSQCLHQITPASPISGQGDLHGGLGNTIIGLPEQLSFLAMQSTITNKAARIAKDILKNPNVLVGMRPESPDAEDSHSYSFGSEMRSAEKLKKQRAPWQFGYAGCVSRDEREEVIVMKFHRFRPILVTIDSTSTLRVHNINTRKRIIQISQRNLEDTNIMSWAGPGTMDSHSTRQRDNKNGSALPFCPLCAISKFSFASLGREKSFNRFGRATLRYALNERPEFLVNSVELLNENSPHGILAAGCDDGYVRMYSNYENEQMCRLVSAFHISKPDISSNSTQPANIACGFWESWEGLNLRGSQRLRSASWDPYFSPLLLNSIPSLSKHKISMERAGHYLRSVDNLRYHPAFFSVVQEVRSTVAKKSIGFSRIIKSGKSRRKNQVQILKTDGNTSSTLFTLFEQNGISEFDLVNEQKVWEFRDNSIKPIVFDAERKFSRFLLVGDERGGIFRVDKRQERHFDELCRIETSQIASIRLLNASPNLVSVSLRNGSFRLYDIRRPQTAVHTPSALFSKRAGTSPGFPSDLGDGAQHGFQEVARKTFQPISAIDTHRLTNVAAVGNSSAPEFSLVTPYAQELEQFSLSKHLNVWRSPGMEHIDSMAWHPIHNTLAISISSAAGESAGRSQIHLFALQ
eukprot:gnl/Chilomastix_cuspidata/2183.p1 GENE.gnl/Chilomastix_cuspidata/2183~~gnl/Chilomastix_cuspidata/2183.p1  ORF type:complete len:2303 (+),score=586.57 gnl/Chilomastix_cuspidata/2183:9925-16833(+)